MILKLTLNLEFSFAIIWRGVKKSLCGLVICDALLAAAYCRPEELKTKFKTI